MTKIKLPIGSLPFLREMDSRLISYNIEMTEVTGETLYSCPDRRQRRSSPAC